MNSRDIDFAVTRDRLDDAGYQSRPVIALDDHSVRQRILIFEVEKLLRMVDGENSGEPDPVPVRAQRHRTHLAHDAEAEALGPTRIELRIPRVDGGDRVPIPGQGIANRGTRDDASKVKRPDARRFGRLAP